MIAVIQSNAVLWANFCLLVTPEDNTTLSDGDDEMILMEEGNMVGLLFVEGTTTPACGFNDGADV
jgi:hypothetical protein